MAVRTRAEIIASLQEAADRSRTIQSKAQTLKRIREGGEESLRPVPPLQPTPTPVIIRETPGGGTAVR
jgi:hypothetical protein